MKHLGLCLLLIPCLCFTLSASQSDGTTAPEGVTLRISFAAGKSVFRQGEIITLQLEYASSAAGVYYLKPVNYSRPGEPVVDEFRVSPRQGLADPLRDFFKSVSAMVTGGPPPAAKLLGPSPYETRLDLNHYYRFDTPGHFQVQLISRRIFENPELAVQKDAVGAPVASNALDLEIVPAEPEWQADELQRTIRLLNGPGTPQRRQACRTLRFLGSEASVQELARRFTEIDQSCEWEYAAGLYGSPNRDLAVREMENLLVSSSFAVSVSFLHTLACLAAGRQSPDASQARFNELRWDIEAEYADRLANAIGGKSPPARAASGAALIEMLNTAGNGKAAASARIDAIRAQVATGFQQLPHQQQWMLLAWRWELLDGPAMVPVLQRIYENPPPMSPPSGLPGFRELALERLLELAPDEARRLVVEQLQRDHPNVGVRVLELLPGQALPELDESFMQKIVTARSIEGDRIPAARLVARYASAAILPRVASVYADKTVDWPCEARDAFLAFFLRVDPAFGADRLAEALSSSDACSAGLLTGIGSMYSSPELERAAVTRLDTPDAQAAADAALALGRYGSAAAQEPLWRRASSLGAQAKRGGQSAARAGMARDELQVLDVNLMKALAQAQAWLAKPDDLEKLRALCVSEDGCRIVDRAIRYPRDRVAVQFVPVAAVFPDGRQADAASFLVNQYQPRSFAALKEKLAQFPPGTTIVWKLTSMTSAREKRMAAEIKPFLEERGMHVEN